MLKLAANGIVSFSDAPLRLALWVGMAVSAMALLYAAWVFVGSLIGSDYVRGWSSTVVITSFLIGINMLMTGIMGLYVGRIHNEVKGRPLYLVGNAVGFERDSAAAAQEPAPPVRTVRGGGRG